MGSFSNCMLSPGISLLFSQRRSDRGQFLFLLRTKLSCLTLSSVAAIIFLGKGLYFLPAKTEMEQRRTEQRVAMRTARAHPRTAGSSAGQNPGSKVQCADRHTSLSFTRLSLLQLLCLFLLHLTFIVSPFLLSLNDDGPWASTSCLSSPSLDELSHARITGSTQMELMSSG